jgi:DNA polymerase-3 subunit alpha (Gram-positive type)
MKEAPAVKVGGTAQFDPFSKELGVIADVILEEPGTKKAARMDESKVKRVELHMHTKMSQMDAITNAKDLIKRAMKWGMKSIAITDHGVVQSFPEAHKMLGYDNPDMKIIYGVEAYYVPDKEPNVNSPKGQDIDTTYCVLDLETTGLSFRTEKITEIGIMKYKDGEVIDSFSTFVNPQRPIPQEVIDVTHITDEMVADAPKINEIMPKVLEFIGDSVIVAHNADFDVGFLKYNCKQLGLKLENTYVDTLRLAKDLFPDYKKYKLGIIADNLGIKVDVAHRALDDVDTTVKVFRVMIDMLKEKMHNATSEVERENYRRVIEQLER